MYRADLPNRESPTASVSLQFGIAARRFSDVASLRVSPTMAFVCGHRAQTRVIGWKRTRVFTARLLPDDERCLLTMKEVR